MRRIGIGALMILSFCWSQAQEMDGGEEMKNRSKTPFGFYIGYVRYFEENNSPWMNSGNDIKASSYRIEPSYHFGDKLWSSLQYGFSSFDFTSSRTGFSSTHRTFYQYIGASINYRIFPFKGSKTYDDGMVYVKIEAGATNFRTQTESFPRNDWDVHRAAGLGVQYHFWDQLGVYAEHTFGSYTDTRFGVSLDF